MKMIDSHCHIHSDDYGLDVDKVIKLAQEADITKFVCVGSGVEDSEKAIEFVSERDNCWASIGLHPHDAKLGIPALDQLEKLLEHKNDASRVQPWKVVAVGECGLDYHYMHSSKSEQARALHRQISMAVSNDLPLIFHIRDAFEDFWPIYDQYPDARGVVHSFTAGPGELDDVLSRGLMVGINGIVTFTKDRSQLDVAKAVPLDSLVLETDAPFLTPAPFRGTINEPKQILQIAKFLSDLRDESLGELAKATTKNAEKLYNI